MVARLKSRGAQESLTSIKAGRLLAWPSRKQSRAEGVGCEAPPIGLRYRSPALIGIDGGQLRRAGFRYLGAANPEAQRGSRLQVCHRATGGLVICTATVRIANGMAF